MLISALAAEHLRTGLRNGRWGGTLPGVARLAQNLDVSRDTVRTALRQLEAEGVIAFVLHQGPERWSVSTAFKDLFELPEPMASEVAPFLPKFRHALLDLLQADPATQQAAMTIAQTLIARGKDLGRQEGAVRGMWIGKIISLQEVMGFETDTLEALSGLTMTEMELRHQALRGEYDVRFKG